MKRRISFIIVVCLVLSLSIVAYASNGSVTKTLFYNNIKVTLNGKEVALKDANGNIVEPFIIDGTTYLPVRGVAGALNLDVDWDSATNTVVLKEKSYLDSSGYPDSSDYPDNSGYSRQNPAPVGVKQTYSVDNWSGKYTATASINSIDIGEAALSKIKAANMFNSEPKDGMEYILANVTVTLISSDNDSAIDFSRAVFDVYSTDNVEYDNLFAAVAPDPQFGGKIFPGGTMTGYVVFMVNKSDAHPKVVIDADYKGAGGAWFSLR